MTGTGEPSLQGLSVLVAEDSWHLADAMKFMIEQAGGTVVGPVGKLAQAERLAAAGNFQAAVMDLNLHGALAHDLALRMAARGTKVVVLTGYEPPEELVGKVHACLTKPVETTELLAALIRPMSQPAP